MRHLLFLAAALTTAVLLPTMASGGSASHGACTFYVGSGTSSEPCATLGLGTVNSNVWSSTPSHAVRTQNYISIGTAHPLDGVCLRYVRTNGTVIKSKCGGPGSRSLSEGGSNGEYAKAQCTIATYAFKKVRYVLVRMVPLSAYSSASGFCFTRW